MRVCSAKNDVNAVILLDIYHALGGTGWFEDEGWSNEDKTLNPCSPAWYGVACDASLSNVVNLTLARNNLKGDLPNAVGRLVHLMVLDLSGNEVSGGLNPVLGGEGVSPPDLEELYLGDTFLSGPLPKGAMELEELRVLDLRNTRISGEMPENWVALQNLEFLDLSGTFLSGPLPILLCDLAKLRYISVASSNSVTGTLSNCFFDKFLLPNLEYLDVSETQLAGEIPRIPEGGPGGLKLRHLVLARTDLSGPLHDSFWSIPTLQHLDLSYIPLGDTNVSASRIKAPLQSLRLAHTGVSTALLRSLCSADSPLLPTLRVLDMSFSKLRDEIPDCIGNFSALTELDLGSNDLEGYVPATVSALQQLETVDLSRNKLEGLKDMDVCAMPVLRRLYLGNNDLRELPKITCASCTGLDLEILDLSSNNLQAPQVASFLPIVGQTQVVSLRSNILTVLDFDRIYECSPVPEDAALRTLDVSQNRLSALNCVKGPSLHGSYDFSISTLLASGNDLTSDQAGDCLATGTWPVLQEVDLSSNQLKTLRRARDPRISEDLIFFPKAAELRSLDLSFNDIHGIAEATEAEFGRLQVLLAASNPHLFLSPTQLPESLVVVSLENSNASLNDRDDIWRWIDLNSLTELRLRNSSFNGGIPDAFRRFSALRLLDLSDNENCRNQSVSLPEQSQESSYQSRDGVEGQRGVPDWLLPSGKVGISGDGTYQCPDSFIPSPAATSPDAHPPLDSDLQVYLDPEYYGFSFCVCMSGHYYGIAPHCKRCPENADCTPDVSTDPRCYPGFFFAYDTEGCESCSAVSGASCPGHQPPNDSLHADVGWWRNETGVNTLHPGPHFLRCMVEHACEGGLHSATSCAHGYEGPLCARCSHDWYLLEGGECEPCEQEDGGVVVGQLFLIIGFPLFLAVYLGSRTPPKKKKKMGVTKKGILGRVSGYSRSHSLRNQNATPLKREDSLKRKGSIRSLSSFQSPPSIFSAAAHEGDSVILAASSSDSEDSEDEEDDVGHVPRRLELATREEGWKENSGEEGEGDSDEEGGEGGGGGGDEEDDGDHHHSHHHDHHHDSHHEHEHDSLGHGEHAYHRLHLMVYFVQILLNSRILGGLVGDDGDVGTSDVVGFGDDDTAHHRVLSVGSGGEHHGDEGEDTWTHLKHSIHKVDLVIFWAYNTFTRICTCVLGVTYESEFWIIIMAPFVVMVILHFMRHLLRMKQVWLKTLLVCFIFYSGLTVASIHMLLCDHGEGQYGGKSFLRRDYRIECTSHDAGFVFTQVVATLVLLCWTVGLPFGLVFVLCYRKNRLKCDEAWYSLALRCRCSMNSSASVLERTPFAAIGENQYGKESAVLPTVSSESATTQDEVAVFGSLAFLTREYAPRFYYWESVELLKAALFNFLFRAGGLGVAIQFAIATTLAFIFLIAHVWLHPFRDLRTNLESILMNLLLWVLCFCGLLLQLGSSEELAVGGRISTSIQDEFAAVIKTLMLVVLAIWGLLFAYQVLAILVQHGWVRSGAGALLSFLAALCSGCCGKDWKQGRCTVQLLALCGIDMHCRCVDCIEVSRRCAGGRDQCRVSCSRSLARAWFFMCSPEHPVPPTRDIEAGEFDTCPTWIGPAEYWPEPAGSCCRNLGSFCCAFAFPPTDAPMHESRHRSRASSGWRSRMIRYRRTLESSSSKLPLPLPSPSPSPPHSQPKTSPASK